MKKLFFAVLIAVSISGSAIAQDLNQVDQKAVNNFEASFTGASNVEWSLNESFAKATFKQNEQKVEVFYNLSGDFVASTRETNIEELPTFAKRILAKKYNDYTVKEAFKFKSDDETGYYISVENETENIVLKEKQGSLIVYSRTTKI